MVVISSAGRLVGLQGPPALVVVDGSPLLLQEMTLSKVPNLGGEQRSWLELFWRNVFYLINMALNKTKASGWHRVFSAILFLLLCFSHLRWLFYSISLGLQQWHGMSHPGFFPALLEKITSLSLYVKPALNSCCPNLNCSSLSSCWESCRWLILTCFLQGPEEGQVTRLVLLRQGSGLPLEVACTS